MPSCSWTRLRSIFSLHLTHAVIYEQPARRLVISPDRNRRSTSSTATMLRNFYAPQKTWTGFILRPHHTVRPATAKSSGKLSTWKREPARNYGNYAEAACPSGHGRWLVTIFAMPATSLSTTERLRGNDDTVEDDFLESSYRTEPGSTSCHPSPYGSYCLSSEPGGCQECSWAGICIQGGSGLATTKLQPSQTSTSQTRAVPRGFVSFVFVKCWSQTKKMVTFSR